MIPLFIQKKEDCAEVIKLQLLPSPAKEDTEKEMILIYPRSCIGHKAL
jgi:hypothetical protein